MKVQISGYVIDTQQESIRRDGVQVFMPNRDSCLLFYLLRHAGRVVPKDELFEHVWTNRIVEDTALPRAISHLRSFFNDVDHQLIKTVPKRGYLLVLDANAVLVDALPAEREVVIEAPTVDSTATPATAARASSGLQHGKYVALLAFVLAGLFSWLHFRVPEAATLSLRFHTADPTARSLLGTQIAKAAAQLQPSLAVSGAASSSKNALVVEVALLDPPDGPAYLTLTGAGSKVKVIFQPGIENSVDSLSQGLANLLGRHVSRSVRTASNEQPPINAANSLVNSQLDFEIAKTQLLDDYARGDYTATTEARLAFALNEVGEQTWPMILAGNALLQRSALDEVDACLAEFVWADAAITAAAALADASRFTKTACNLAQARLAEGRGQLPAALSALQGEDPRSILLALKKQELRVRTGTVSQPEAERRLAFDKLINMARDAGWQRGLARIYELKGDVLFGVESREWAIAAYEAAAASYLAVNDPISGGRVRAARALLLNNFDSAAVADARSLIRLAEAKGDHRSALTGWLVVFKYGHLPEPELQAIFRKVVVPIIASGHRYLDVKLISKVLTVAHNLTPDPLSYETRLALASQTAGYPRLSYQIYGDIASGALNTGNIKISLDAFHKIDSLRVMADALGIAPTHYCVAGFAALEATNTELARRWFGICTKYSFPTSVGCVRLIGFAGTALADYADTGVIPDLTALVQGFEVRNAADANCEAVALLIAGMALRGGNLKRAAAMLEFLHSSPRASRLRFELAMVEAEHCLVTGKFCTPSNLQHILENSTSSASERAQALAKLLPMQAPRCEQALKAQANQAIEFFRPRAATLLVQRLECALSICAGTGTASACPNGRLGIYL